jgi:Fic family protein
MANLERVINDDSMLDVDPLVRMAVIHYQFESIHPFYDGNGRTGRIINVLYLVQKGLLDIPVLYLSRHFIRSKNDYYRLLQAVRDSASWEEGVVYVLEGIEQTSKETIAIIERIGEALMTYKHRIRAEFKFYSQDLISNLFYHTYTKIGFMMSDISVSRLTATRYREGIVGTGLLRKEKIGRSNFYINTALYDILTEPPHSSKVQDTCGHCARRWNVKSPRGQGIPFFGLVPSLFIQLFLVSFDPWNTLDPQVDSNAFKKAIHN